MKRPSLKSSTQISSSRCSHTTSNGSRCRMSAAPDSRYCRSHDRFARRDTTALSAELSKVAGSLVSPEQVRRFLAKILVALVEDRVSPRKAAVVGYLSQMLLQSQREVVALKDSEQEPTQEEFTYEDTAPSAIKTRGLQRQVLFAEEALKSAKEALAADQTTQEQCSTSKQVLSQPPQSNPPIQPSNPIATDLTPQLSVVDQETQPADDEAEQRAPAKSKPKPKTPPPDLNHFYPIDPTLKPGQQNASNSVLSSTDPEELRWRELSQRFAPRRR